jgi:hypothetical protein
MFVKGVKLIEQEGVTGGHVCYEESLVPCSLSEGILGHAYTVDDVREGGREVGKGVSQGRMEGRGEVSKGR